MGGLTPVDVVAPAHVWVDGELLTWGRWLRYRSARIRCGSAEGQYRAPWRQWVMPSAEDMMPRPLDAQIWKVDSAVVSLPEFFRRACVWHYVRAASPFVTVRQLRKLARDRQIDFGRVMYEARAIVLIVLNRNDNAHLTTARVGPMMATQFETAKA